MSKRAADAYDNGEMPKSKWTKAAMLAALAEALEELEDEGITITDEQVKAIEKLSKSDMFKYLFDYTGWHHTSKYFNMTEFYGVDADRLEDFIQDGCTFTPVVEYCVGCGSFYSENHRVTERSLESYLRANGFLKGEYDKERTMYTSGSVHVIVRRYMA